MKMTKSVTQWSKKAPNSPQNHDIVYMPDKTPSQQAKVFKTKAKADDIEQLRTSWKRKTY